MDDVINDFLIESHEGLDQLDRDLIALESAPDDHELLARIFRCVHTVKGTCGFLGYGKLESVSHVGENLLVKLRDGALRNTPEIISALLALVDAIREMLASIEAAGSEGDGDYSALKARLASLHDSSTSQALAELLSSATNSEIIPIEADSLFPQPSAKPRRRKRTTRSRTEHSETELADTTFAEMERSGAVGSHRRSGARNAKPIADSRSSVSESSIRVDVAQLDKLMTLVGELVLTRNQILQHANSTRDASITAPAQRLDILTSELQEGVMKTRMQPIGTIWSKFPRVVRDLSVECGKQVRLEMEGAGTELDKTIIEAIKDPLTHIVRNAADHGIELPDVRIRNGKPIEGRLTLRAYHEGGQVVIEIADDGSGMDVDRIRQKAVERGLITTEQASAMNDREALHLVFLPGLSTAKSVTKLSGRGVGMDVVKSNIEKIGGAIDLQSTRGAGSMIKIKIPLTLAIIPTLIVSCAGNRYAIPQVNLLELVRDKRQGNSRGIEMMHGAPVYRLRGNLLPLVDIRSALQIAGSSEARDGALHIVVLQADDRQFGLIVDEINDTEEIVVKPLDKQLKSIAVFAGATIMGDGRVALILDVMGLAQRAHVVSGTKSRNRTEVSPIAHSEQSRKQNLLVCGLDDARRVAIPLSSVARLEEFSCDAVEHAGDYDVVQYRDEILPLLNLNALLGISGVSNQSTTFRAVVYSENGRNVGFVVRQIVDIVQDEIDIDRTTMRSGILGSIVLQNRVTDVLDMSEIVHSAAPWLLTRTLEVAA